RGLFLVRVMAVLHHPAAGDHHVAHEAWRAAEDQRIGRRIAALLGVQHHQVRAPTGRDRAHRPAHGLRATGSRLQPKGGADRLRFADHQIALARDEALHIFEQAQLLGWIARHVAVAADAVAAARAAIVDERKDAVAEVPFGSWTQAGDRAALREAD